MQLVHLALVTLLSLAGVSGPNRPGNSNPGSSKPVASAVGSIHCTPTTVSFGGRAEPAKSPIAAALNRARPGDVITLQAGDYPNFTIGFDKNSPWNARTSGGRPGQPITVRGVGKVRVIGKGSGDTIAFSQKVKNGHITFENLTIIPAGRAALMFYKTGGSAVYEGFKFYDCDILGSWDHTLDRGQTSKWAVWAHSLKDFEFVGKRRPAVIRNIRHEHAFYIQNPRGNILIQNVQATQLGRTFTQFTARPGDGPPGVGNITVKDCVVEDVCIAKGDNYKGGYPFTVAGRITGTVLFENNTYRAGFRPELRRLTRSGQPYGTGALVAWDGGGEPNGTLILRNNRFHLASGCGDRPAVSIGGCNVVRIEGQNTFIGGGKEPTLEIDAMNKGKTRNSPVGSIYIDPKTVVEGPVEQFGRRRTLAELSDG